MGKFEIEIVALIVISVNFYRFFSLYKFVFKEKVTVFVEWEFVLSVMSGDKSMCNNSMSVK